MNKKEYYYNLIKELTIADFKLKYYGSVLGFFWTFLKPFLMLAILYVVFTKFLNIGTEHYASYLLLGIIIWNFFADATREGMQSMKNKADIMGKVNISPIIILLSSILSSTITFFINFIVCMLFFLAVGQHIAITALLSIPLLALYIFFIIGVSGITALLYMRFTDFSHIWDVFLQLLFWATPIVYAAELIPKTYIHIVLLNPVARVIVDARNILIAKFIPEPKQWIITILLTLIIGIIGLYLFKKHARALSERS